jgi:hypothetical protein
MMKTLLIKFLRELYQGNISALIMAGTLLYFAWIYFGQNYYLQYKQEVAVSHELLGEALIRIQTLEAELHKKEAKQVLDNSEYGVNLEGEY